MLRVGAGLVDELDDVVVDEAVADVAAVALGVDEAVLAQVTQLVGDRRLLHADRGRDLADGEGAGAEAVEDEQPAGRRERLQDVGEGAGSLGAQGACCERFAVC